MKKILLFLLIFLSFNFSFSQDITETNEIKKEVRTLVVGKSVYNHCIVTLSVNTREQEEYGKKPSIFVYVQDKYTGSTILKKVLFTKPKWWVFDNNVYDKIIVKNKEIYVFDKIIIKDDTCFVK